MRFVAFVLPFGRSRKSLLPLLLLFTLPALVQAQFTFTTNNGTITITGYTGSGGTVSIPNKIDSLSVVGIGYGAFEYCTSLTNVTIPDSVTDMGSYAFSECANLTQVTIGTNLTGIGYCAFNGCTSLASVTIPDSVTTIGMWAFCNCSELASFTIPNGVSSIEGSAFNGCTSLTNVTIPDSVTTIGQRAFADCPSLTSVTIPKNVTSIGYAAFFGCTSLTGVYFKGNAPATVPPLFSGDDNVTVYYLAGATGWDSPFAERLPPILWNAQVLASSADFGVRTNRFGLNITGTTNISIVVEACTNLANARWTPLQSCTITNGLIYFSDAQWTNYPARFYRIRSP